MRFISRLIKKEDGPGFPFSVPAIAATDELSFHAPVTILCGDNGSGKSTLLSILAAKLQAVRIGQGVIAREQAVDAVQDAFTLHKLPCKRNFFFSAEDFIAYITWITQTREEALAEIARIDADDSIADKSYAKMPHYRTLADLSRLYEGDLSRQSHGEGFLDFFQSRLHPGGVYLLDEPEGALSFEKQFALALLIRDAAESCQFILATHSPILAAIPGAQVLESTAEGFLPRTYDELENIQFLKLFMANPDRMFR